MDNEVIEKTGEQREPLIDHINEPCKFGRNNMGILTYVLVGIVVIFLITAGFIVINKNQGQTLVSAADIKKPLSDYREYRVIRLPNKLDALLISDPKTTESSASITVGVGAHMDMGTHGLAHFCEHMLFLGSKTFPKPGSLDDHLNKHSGSNNAFTQAEKTTYYFTVNNEGVDLSLDIFSKMFAEPLFDRNYTQKEINAVNSEHEKNLDSDDWKKMQLVKSFGNPNHPHFGFSTGNSETLNKTSNINEKLLEFFEKYYLASNMKLTILSNGTLNHMQELAGRYFSTIPDRTPNSTLYGNLETNEAVLRPSDLGKIAWYKKSSGADLNIMFSIESINPHYKSKPLAYFNYLFKYSGDKSLLSFLRKRKLATKIDSGVEDSNVSFGSFGIEVELTDEGLRQVDFVIKLVFNYVNLIKDSPMDSSLFKEIQKISALNFKFMDTDNDYSSYTAKISNKMFNYDYTDLLYGEYALNVFDEGLIKKFMNSLSAKNSIILIGAENNNFTSEYLTDKEIKHEKWYDTEYMINSLDEKILVNLNLFPVFFDKNENVDADKTFNIRKANGLISNSADLVKDCRETRDSCGLDEYDTKKGDLTPITLVDDINLKLLYKIDKSFKLPKINIVKKLTFKNFNSNASNYFYSTILSNYLEYNLSVSLGEAMETGNTIKIQISNDGIYLDILAYSDIAYKLVHAISNEIFKFHPESIIFDDIVQVTKNNLMSIRKSGKPFKKNNLFFQKMIKPNYILYTELIEAYKNNQINFHDFQIYCEDFKNDMLMTVLIYGSIDVEEVDRLSKDLRSFFPKTRSKDTKYMEKHSSISALGVHREISDMTTLNIKNDADNQINHAVNNYYQVGIRDYENFLYMNIIDKCIGKLFYHNLRTVQQLGYIVSSYINTIDSVLYYNVVVQGSKLAPLEIAYEIDKVFPLAVTSLEECRQSDYKEVIESIRTYISKKDNNLNERSSRIWKEVDVNGNDFNRQKNLHDALGKLDLTKVVPMFNKIFYENPKRLAVHHYASNSKSFEATSGNSSVDLKEFQLNKNLKIKYTEDLNVLKDQQILQKKRIMRTKATKFKLANTNTASNLGHNERANKSKASNDQNKSKVKNLKMQKLVKDFSELSNKMHKK